MSVIAQLPKVDRSQATPPILENQLTCSRKWGVQKERYAVQKRPPRLYPNDNGDP
ncbi:MAG: hypothetical protein M1813_009734 [Trichoglossum hirsutum]|nr:MAG: hypothetical protein M1813_009734 [Trichoglossum hirsutum]